MEDQYEISRKNSIANCWEFIRRAPEKDIVLAQSIVVVLRENEYLKKKESDMWDAFGKFCKAINESKHPPLDGDGNRLNDGDRIYIMVEGEREYGTLNINELDSICEMDNGHSFNVTDDYSLIFKA